MNDKLRKIADKLVTTLGSMPPEEADQVVFNIAHLIYTDMLGLKGEIKKTFDVSARINGKCRDIVKYGFVEEKEEKWNENVETCENCGIQWKKIGKQCKVCYQFNKKD